LSGLHGSLGLASATLEAHIRRTLEGQAARAEAAEVRLEKHACSSSVAWPSLFRGCSALGSCRHALYSSVGDIVGD
jgi:hypothetical protein